MQEYKDWLTKLEPEDMPNEDIRLVAECCGMDTAIKLLQEMGGVVICIPKLGGKRLYRRYIQEVCDGSVSSMRRIALHLGVSESYVQKIYRGYLDGGESGGRSSDIEIGSLFEGY
jgi:hypothetical protein